MEFATWRRCCRACRWRCTQSATTAVTASDTGALAWKGDLLALGVFEDAITPAGKGEGALSACASVSVDARGGLHPSKGCYGGRSAHLMYHKYWRLLCC